DGYLVRFERYGFAPVAYAHDSGPWIASRIVHVQPSPYEHILETHLNAVRSIDARNVAAMFLNGLLKDYGVVNNTNGSFFGKTARLKAEFFEAHFAVLRDEPFKVHWTAAINGSICAESRSVTHHAAMIDLIRILWQSQHTEDAA